MGAAAWLRAQDPVFKTGVEVVNILATVRDKKGGLVANLEKDDFHLSEDGKPVSIRYFSRETDLPLTLGLLIDTSGSQRKVLDAERGASYRFVDEVLRPEKDRVFLMQFDSSVQVPQALTNSRAKLSDALAYVDTETMKQLEMRQGGGTLLYDAIAQASDVILKKLQGRKALILLTDGVDVGSNLTASDAAEAAQKADVLLYSILYADPGAYAIFGAGRDGKQVLHNLSSDSGGGFYEVSKKQPVDAIFAAIEAELRSQYNIGYVPDEAVTISRFKNIDLKTKAAGLVVQARKRYWAQAHY